MRRTSFLITAAVVGVICLLGWNGRSTTPLALAQNGACSVDMQFIIDSSLSMLGKFDNSAPANSYNAWEIKTSAQQFIIEQVYSQLQTSSYEHDRRWFIHYRADPPSWYQIFDNSPPGLTSPESYGSGPSFYDPNLNQSNSGDGKQLASAINIAKDKLANPTLRAQEPNNKKNRHIY